VSTNILVGLSLIAIGFFILLLSISAKMDLILDELKRIK